MTFIPFCLANYMLLFGTVIFSQNPTIPYETIDEYQGQHADMIIKAGNLKKHGPMVNVICGCLGEEEARKLQIYNGKKT